MAIESDPCYPFYVPPPFPPFTPSNEERLLEEDYQPISDLELHFNTLFMLESEKGRNYHNKSNTYDPNPKNEDVTSHLTLLDDCSVKQKKLWTEKENVINSHCNNGVEQNNGTTSCLEKSADRSSNMNIRSDSFTMSELSTSSYTTSNNNQHSSFSDYGSLKSASLEEPDWKYYSDVNFTRLEDRYNWLDEKCENKEDDVFFDSNFTGRLTPDSISDEVLGISHKTPLPPLETAFSKHFGRFSERDASIPQNGSVTCNNLDLYITNTESKPLSIDNLDGYCYPNNILFSNEINNKNNLSDKNSDYSELFDKIGYDGNKKVNNFDNEKKTAFTDDKLSFFDEKKIANNLIEDLDSLNYYKQDDDNLIGFEEYCEQKESSFEIHDGGDILSTIIEDDVGELESQKDERICFWKDCEIHFPNQTTLVEHIEKVHVNTYKGEEFSCLWCACARETRPFNARYKLLIHMRVHSGHKPNKCGFPGCGKAFSRLENLKIHRRSHTGERPYRCQAPRCSKAFSNSSDRAKHQRTHFNARPYACQIEGCTKRYTDPSSLRKHVKNHSSPTSRISTKLIQETRKPGSYTPETPPRNFQSQRNSKLVTIAVQQKIKMDRITNSTKQNASNLKTIIGLRSSKRLNNIEEESRRQNSKRMKINQISTFPSNSGQEDSSNFLDISEASRPTSSSNMNSVNFGDVSSLNNVEHWSADRKERGGKLNDRYSASNNVFDQDGTDFDQYVQEQFNIGYFEESFS